ncbi:MAG: response regulator [Patescibacteria group bacterium]
MRGKTVKRKVLVIDDDEFLAGIYILTLKKAGFDIELQKDGTSGLRVAKKIKPAAIILDVLMPGIDGFQVLRELKENRTTKNIPVLMLTTLSQNEDVEMGLAAGADVYLTKTTSLPNDVVSKLNELLNK